MIAEENVLVMDIDGTICENKKEHQSYLDLRPKYDVLDKLREYRQRGFYIILYSSRQMRTYKGNVGKINANTAKTLFQWLDKHDIPYDEIHFGKPWCGRNGFYVDDKAIRPSEFLQYSLEEIQNLLKREDGVS
ncbi:HAD-IIIC family phosphatase [Cohnella suwonensis]|uniref:HAD-IIIC family phosphatase n=1 Tax=Cohnella suwonensis TaxID=696072 RepID=A0ABW0LXN7_9BACL